MIGLVALGLLAPGPAPPAPVPPPAPAAARVDRGQALAFARTVYTLADAVAANYAREVPLNDLIGGAVRGLFDEAGVPVPDDLREAARTAASASERVTLLVDARQTLGANPRLAGARGLFAAVDGFRHATDSYGGLVFPRVNSYSAADMDFGIGVELEGVGGPRWTLYQVERQAAITRVEPGGWVGPLPARDAVVPPVGFPWRVRKVVPGSPAQAAGIRPGDVVTHLNGAEVTAGTSGKLFNEFAFPPPVFDPATGRPGPVRRELALTRDGKTITARVEAAAYAPEAVHGVYRKAGGKWDGMLDPAAKIGYARVGTVEEQTDARLAELVADLTKRGCRGLILDLRWCPGGWVLPATRVAGLFLPDGATVARFTTRDPRWAMQPDVVRATSPAKFPDLPLVVLVGAGTTGGGELMAAALRDNKRCVVMGQRTGGRAAVFNTIDAGFAGLLYKVTTGAALRPTGVSHQKWPDSHPTDPWGVRPDPGLEVPVTADLAAELRMAAEHHALRPAGSDDALPWDDPATDPVRLAALAYLRKELGRAVGGDE